MKKILLLLFIMMLPACASFKAWVRDSSEACLPLCREALGSLVLASAENDSCVCWAPADSFAGVPSRTMSFTRKFDSGGTIPAGAELGMRLAPELLDEAQVLHVERCSSIAAPLGHIEAFLRGVHP